MEKLSSGQQQTRSRIESAISFASPVFDLILNVGERISRIAEPIDHEYYPIHTEEADAERSEATKSKQ